MNKKSRKINLPTKDELEAMYETRRLKRIEENKKFAIQRVIDQKESLKDIVLAEMHDENRRSFPVRFRLDKCRFGVDDAGLIQDFVNEYLPTYKVDVELCNGAFTLTIM